MHATYWKYDDVADSWKIWNKTGIPANCCIAAMDLVSPDNVLREAKPVVDLLDIAS